MKVVAPLFCALLGMVSAGKASADITLYDNGPINGNVNAWGINESFAVGDSFTLASESAVSSFSFGYWVLPGDTISNLDWSVTSQALGGTTYDASTGSEETSVASPASPNNFGYDLFTGTVNTGAVDLPAGTYYLNLQNAITTTQGDPAYWDENDGTSLAESSATGPIGSESFQIYGNTDVAAVPEPTGSVSLVSGAVLTALFVRRRSLPAYRSQSRH